MLSVLASLLYFAFVAAIGAVASSRGLCGEGDLLPSCVMFTVATAGYGLVGIGAVSTLATLAAMLLRRRVAPLLKASCVLHGAALLSLGLPVRTVGNKLAGAVVVMLVLPFTALLEISASACFVLWLGRAMARSLAGATSNGAVTLKA